jgi:hypothetical protein
MDETQEARDQMAERLRLTLALHDEGVALMRQNVRRKYPAASSDEIRTHVRLWLRAPAAGGHEHHVLSPKSAVRT